MEAITADAAQFFKDSATKHAIDRTCFYVGFVLKKHPNAVVAIAKSIKAKGFIATSKKHVPASYDTVDVHDILRALEFSTRHDRNFAVGSVASGERMDGLWGAT